jgi:hypothetical protein
MSTDKGKPIEEPSNTNQINPINPSTKIELDLQTIIKYANRIVIGLISFSLTLATAAFFIYRLNSDLKSVNEINSKQLKKIESLESKIDDFKERIIYLEGLLKVKEKKDKNE